ncbi:glycosyltransferase family 2 protein [Streptomyces sp. NPDC015032]|uniref:glycosyltransferase family 2 protein n=1 Tax=Streptomyces sp. NPDC015032 TaxID=3364937 RepID=UPI0036FFEED9
MNDRPEQERAAQATLMSQQGVDLRICVVGNGCVPDIVPAGALTVALETNIGIPGGRNAGAQALAEASRPDQASYLFFLDNDAVLPTDDALARLIAEAYQHPEAAYVQPRLTGPDDVTTPRRWVPRLRAGEPGRPGTITTMTEGVVLVRRNVFDALGGWGASLFLYHEGLDLACRCWAAGWTGWYAADLRMHHPVTSPTRHAPFHRLAARNRITVAYRNLPRSLIPLYLGNWAVITLARLLRHGGTHESVRGMREGWALRHAQTRRPMSWQTVWRLTAAGRPPII